MLQFTLSHFSENELLCAHPARRQHQPSDLRPEKAVHRTNKEIRRTYNEELQVAARCWNLRAPLHNGDAAVWVSRLQPP